MLLFNMGFEVLDISGDAAIRAYGGSVEELFESAAMGMYSLITYIKKIDEKHEIDIEASGDSAEGLLVSYLNELIFQFDAYGFIGKRIVVSNISLQPLFFIKAKIYGEDFDESRHEQHLLIKAATYHNLRLEKTADKWTADVVFDI